VSNLPRLHHTELFYTVLLNIHRFESMRYQNRVLLLMNILEPYKTEKSKIIPLTTQIHLNCTQKLSFHPIEYKTCLQYNDKSLNAVWGRKYNMWNKADNCTLDVTLRCVRITIVALEKQHVLHILSVCL